MTRSGLAVVSALREESAALLARGRVEERLRVPQGRFVRLRLGERSLVAGWTGDGATCAAAGLRGLLESVAVERLLLTGIAGGLSPELAIGDLVVAREVRDGEGAAPPPDAAWLGRVTRERPLPCGLLVSAPQIAGTADAKASLWRAHGAIAPAAVDLETAAWARIAGQARVPYLAVRAVSDTASEALPIDFERFRGADGRVRRGRLILHALLHPSRIPHLLELGRRTRLCGERLADLVEHRPLIELSRAGARPR